MKLSVVVPTRDKADLLDRALASYVRQRHRDFEVVIADDGSGDDGAERVAARWRDRFRVIYERTAHRGRAACRNTALRAATGELVVFADDDRLAAPDFLAEHARRYDPERPVVALGAQRRIAVASVDDVLERFDELAAASEPEPWWEEACLPVARAHGDGLDGFHLPWSLGATGNLSAPRALLLRAGGFDEGFSGWGLEDLELCYRLHHLGARTVLLPRAINHHLAHPRPEPGDRWMQWLENLVYFVDKHPRIDAAAYAWAYTRQETVDVAALNRRIGALLDEEAAVPATTAALREAWVAMVRARVFALRWSGAHRLPGVNW